MLASGKEVSESAKPDWQYFQRSFGHRAAPGLREVAGNTVAFSRLLFLLNIFQIVWAVWSRNSTAQSVWPASWRESLIDSFRPTLVMSLACSCCSDCIFKAFPCYFMPLNPKSCLRLALLVMICPLEKGRKGMFTTLYYIHMCVHNSHSWCAVCVLYIYGNPFLLLYTVGELLVFLTRISMFRFLWHVFGAERLFNSVFISV